MTDGRDERVHETTLVFRYPSDRTARVVADSVAREAGAVEGERTRAAVSRDGRELTVRVEAADLVALRAGANTWCSLVEVAERAAGATGRAG